MIAVITCSHFPDDERIYHKEISALSEKNYGIKYFTLSNLKANLSRPGLNHKNYDLSNSVIWDNLKTRASNSNLTFADRKWFKDLNLAKELEIMKLKQNKIRN